ncbi:hypothetical protein T439DRAFT_327816 [Meredithblackwellia eburnea MCA 4105]
MAVSSKKKQLKPESVSVSGEAEPSILSKLCTTVADDDGASSPFLLTLALSHTPVHLLYPLFSSAPTNSITIPFHIFTALVALAIYVTNPLPSRLRWEVLWIALGFVLIGTESLVRINSVKLLGMSMQKGIWSARLLAEGIPTVLRWWLVIRGLSASTVRRPVRIIAGAAVPIYLASGWYPSFVQTIPECYILQIHGVVLILLATFRTSLFTGRTRTSLPLLSRHLILAFTLVTILLTSLTSTHCPASPLRPLLPLPSLTLNTTESRILSAKKSLTGWIVVGEHTARGHEFRYLRADHSILGGLWTGPAREEVIKMMEEMKVSLWEKVDENAVVGTAESIYSTFLMQEIARLAGVPEKQMNKTEKALIIGLGCGLSARALENHGTKTTIVEIDPVVHDFSKKYFGVGEPSGGLYLEDAREFLKRESEIGEKKYDYIIHDVFTGGTVPSLLFTVEFWASAKKVLTPTGIVGINFAGNIKSRASHLVISTIMYSFNHCRAWEDGPPKGDFRNIVILCSPQSTVRMRNPVPVDYLPWPSAKIRKRVFDTYKDFEIDLRGTDRKEVVWDKTKGVLDREQVPGAREHYEIMKKVLPDTVWAVY